MAPRVQPFDPKLLWLGLLVFVAMTVMIIGVAVIQRLRADLLGDEAKPEDILETLRQAHEEGELDDDEFRRVRESIDHSAGGAPEPEPPDKLPG